jgi:hypothetical protein
MRRTLSIAVALLLTAVAALASDVTGNWKATITGMDGNPMEVKMNLKAEVGVITGTVTVMGTDMKVENGKIDGDKVAFEVRPQFGTFSYTGAVSGDELKLVVKMGENTSPLTLKRVP